MFIGSVLVSFCNDVFVMWLTKLATCELLLTQDIIVAWLVQHSHVCFHFAGSKLPNDDGEFYQFCYVAASGQVRGASPPFQFKHPMTDDLIEVEDENGELLVIRTKTAVLEDQLKKANETRAELKQVAVHRWSYRIIQLHDLCLSRIMSVLGILVISDILMTFRCFISQRNNMDTIQYNTIQYKTYNAPYVTKMLFV